MAESKRIMAANYGVRTKDVEHAVNWFMTGRPVTHPPGILVCDEIQVTPHDGLSSYWDVRAYYRREVRQ